RLERLTYKIAPPTWPSTFPTIDRVRAERGRQLFNSPGFCASCHESYETDGYMRTYRLFGLNEVGTDPATALNYEKRVKTADGRLIPFPDAAEEAIKRVKAVAYEELGVS